MKSVICGWMGLMAVMSLAAVELPAPVVWYSMDAKDGNTVADLSGNGRTLIVGTGTTLTDEAALGRALSFDGTTASFATASKMPALADRTISFWVRRAIHPGPYFDFANNLNKMPTLFSGLSAMTARLNNSLRNDGFLGDEQFICWVGQGGSLNGHYFAYNAYPRFTVGVWTHVAIVVDELSSQKDESGETISRFNARIYFNGEPVVVETDCEIAHMTASETLTIGNVGNKTRPFAGEIDEFRVFDQVLTPEQIRAEFARGEASTSCLLAHYPLTTVTPLPEGGFVTPDVSPYGQTLTLTDHVTLIETDVGRAMHFDGTATTRAVTRFPREVRDFTLAMWLNVSTNATLVRISGQSNNFPWLANVGGKFGLRFMKDLVSTRFQYHCDADVTGKDFNVHNLDHAYTGKGGWQHWAFVYRVRHDHETAERSGRAEVWVNGVHVASGPWAPASVIPIDAGLTLGSASFSGNATRAFEGDVADVRLYGGALTTNEMQCLYRGAAAVNAGADQTVAGERTVLCGTVCASAEKDYRRGYCGTVAWTLVSAPAGGEGATMMRPANPVTEVSLPVEGTYVFRLSTATGFDTAFDEVTVVRDDQSGAAPLAVPSVTADLAAANRDAAAAATCANGLIRHWPLTSYLEPFKEVKMGRTLTGVSVYTNNLAGSPSGYAIRFENPRHGAGMGEKPETYDSYTIPNDEWRTFAAWMYQDETLSKAPHYAPCLLSARTTIWVMLNRYSNPATDGLLQTPGITIRQAGVKGAAGWLFYPAPYSFTNRWTHVVAAINRHDTSQCRLWLDGVEQTASVSAFSKYSATSFNDGSHVGEMAGGRAGDNWWIGGIDYNAADYATQSNSIFSVAYDPTTKTFYSRTFPGKLADIRLYNRLLTVDEVAFLARHPGEANHAPVVAQPALDLLTAQRSQALSADTADDGIGTAPPAYEWHVLAQAGAVTFANPAARQTTVTVSRAGTYAFLLKVTDGERTTYGEPVTVEASEPGMTFLLR